MQEVQPTDRVEEPENSAEASEEETQEAPATDGGKDSGKAPKGKRPARGGERPRLLLRYRDELSGQMAQEFSYGNVMEIPQVQKVVLNVGLGEALTNARAMEATLHDIGMITGQRPVATKARRSVATFKLREGQAIGVMATLRGDRMYIFLDKLFNTALPRIRDFRGVSRSAFDGRGNYSLGIREQNVFPEIDYNQIDKLRGFQVNIITSAKTDQEALRLLELLGMPFTRVQEREAVNA
jgi:large subunit ribosomal protein L5